MNGRPTHPAAKHERGTTAADVCTFQSNEGIEPLARTTACRLSNEGRLRGIPCSRTAFDDAIRAMEGKHGVA